MSACWIPAMTAMCMKFTFQTELSEADFSPAIASQSRIPAIKVSALITKALNSSVTTSHHGNIP
jgi:hypothetical protein